MGKKMHLVNNNESNEPIIYQRHRKVVEFVGDALGRAEEEKSTIIFEISDKLQYLTNVRLIAFVKVQSGDTGVSGTSTNHEFVDLIGGKR